MRETRTIGQRGAARAALLLTLLLSTLGACSTGHDAPSSADPSESAGQYAFSEAGFEQCLTDSDVEFRKDGDGGLSIVNPTDPRTSKAGDRCSSLTTKPQSDAVTRFANAVTLAIAHCLSDLGYHVTTNGNTDGLTDGGGNAVATFSLPDSEKQSAPYDADNDRCMKEAEQTIPSPAP